LRARAYLLVYVVYTRFGTAVWDVVRRKVKVYKFLSIKCGSKKDPSASGFVR